MTKWSKQPWHPFTARSPKVWPPLINSRSFIQTLTNQKSRTVSSWLLIGLNLYERMWINKKQAHFWAPCCSKIKTKATYQLGWAFTNPSLAQHFDLSSKNLVLRLGTPHVTEYRRNRGLSIGSLTNDDDDDCNKNGKIAIGLDWQNNELLCTCITLFCTFLCPTYTPTTWKYLVHFLRRTWTRQVNFFFFLNFDTVFRQQIANIWRIEWDD